MDRWLVETKPFVRCMALGGLIGRKDTNNLSENRHRTFAVHLFEGWHFVVRKHVVEVVVCRDALEDHVLLSMGGNDQRRAGHLANVLPKERVDCFQLTRCWISSVDEGW